MKCLRIGSGGNKVNLNSARKYKKNLSLTDGIIKNNVVFSLGLGMPMVIAASTELKNGVIICMLMAVTNLVGGLLHILMGKRVPKIYRVPVIVMSSMAVISFTLPMLSVLNKEISELGIYIPLIAVNSLILDITLMDAFEGLWPNIKKIISYTLGFAIVMCSVSAGREIVSERTIWDIPFELFKYKIVGVQAVFFGFILIGMLAAMFRVLERTIKYITIIKPKYSGKSRKGVGR